MTGLDKLLRARFLSKYKVVKFFYTRAARRGYPATLEVHPTYRCNYKCDFCIDTFLKAVPSAGGFEINRDGHSQLSKENMDAIIRGVIEMQVPGVILSGGGEPTINPNTEYLVARLGKVKVHVPGEGPTRVQVGLFTNGSALSDRNIPTYVDNLTFLRFSFDDFDREAYAATKGVKPELYDRVLDNIRKCVARKRASNSQCSIGIDFIVQPANVRKIPLMYREAIFLGVDYVQFCDCVEQGYQFTENVKSAIQAQIQKAFLMQAEWFTDATRVSMDGQEATKAPDIVYEPLQVQNTRPCTECRAKDYICLVGGDGRVRPGPHTARHDECLYGDLSERSLKEIWEGRPERLPTTLTYEYCRFRMQNDILEALEGIEHGNIL